MKVKIQNRSVYHKFVEVEIEVDKDDLEHFKLENGKYTDIVDYLNANCHLYDEQIDEAMSKASYEYGFGTSADANDYNKSYMNEPESESEWRFECDELKIGGHL